MNDSLSRKSIPVLVTMAVAVLSPTVVFMLAGDAPQMSVLVVVGLVGTFVIRRPLPRTSRSFIYSGVGAFLIATIAHQIMPVDADRFFLIPANVYGPGVLLLAVGATYFEQRDTTITSFIALCIISMLLAGNVVGFSGTYERLPEQWSRELNFHLVFGIGVFVQLLAVLALLPRTQFRRVQGVKPSRRRQALRLCLVFVLMGTTGAIVLGLRATAFRYRHVVESSFSSLFQRYWRGKVGRIVFGRDVDLWRTVPLRTRADKAIVLRATADAPPGYLRGVVYSAYSAGRWSVTGTAEKMSSREAGGRLAYMTFTRETPIRPSGPPKPSRRVGILPASRFSSVHLLCPGRAVKFDLVATSLDNSPDGAISYSDFERGVGYETELEERFSGTAYQGPTLEDPGTRARYLRVPKYLEKCLNGVAAEALAGAPPREATQVTVARLVRFFHDRFTYKLGVEMDREHGDPVRQFLTTHRAGHCELFAASAVLLLRSRGIPARYVTGFVCAEQHPSGRYYLSRLEDAHAWVEAYISETGRWVTVEPTTAAGIPQGNSDFNAASALWDRMGAGWQKLMSLVKKGFMAEAITAFVLGVWRVFLGVLRNPVGLPILLVATFLFGRRMVRRLRRAGNPDALLEDTRWQVRKNVALIEAFGRRIGVPWPTGATVAEYARLLGEQKGAVALTPVVKLLEEYQHLRFGGALPGSEAADGFDKRVRQVLNEVRRTKTRA
ncbi:MAG: transglutaminase domain-containing protein [Lentisphaeria bacterium]|nr:transglutaminase domain-containing protein [Lentisphaeria bacterium]